MFSDLKPYPGYVEDGGSWFPPVPHHWSVRPMRALFDEVRDADHADEPLLSVTIARGVVPQAEHLVDSSKKDSSNLDKSKYKLVLPGDIAYNKMRAWQGALGVSRHRGIVSPAYIVERPRSDLEADYAHHLLRTPGFVKEAQRWSYGITSDMWSLRPEHFRLISCPVPPREEQAAIVRYLAHANRRIDQAIAAKRKLIRLVEEQKQVIINQAITRGLDPQVKMRDSGISWLGDIPAHWEVAPLRRYWNVTDCKHLTVPFVAEGFPLASVTQAQRFYLNLVDAKHTTEENYQSLVEGGRGPRRGDLIYCRNVGVGSAAVVATDEPFAMGQDVCLLRSRDQDPVFLNHYLRSRPMAIQLERLLVGSTFRRINVSQIRALQLLVPSLPEQRQIVAHLNVATEDVEAAITQSQAEIDLLREFRTRLTADVVTGQVDVREIAASLPEVSPAELADSVNESMDDELDELAEEFAEDATLV